MCARPHLINERHSSCALTELGCTLIPRNPQVHAVEEREGNLYVTLDEAGEAESDRYAHNAEIGSRQQPVAARGLHSKFLVGGSVGALGCPPRPLPFGAARIYLLLRSVAELLCVCCDSAGGDGRAPQR